MRDGSSAAAWSLMIAISEAMKASLPCACAHALPLTPHTRTRPTRPASSLLVPSHSRIRDRRPRDRLVGRDVADERADAGARSRISCSTFGIHSTSPPSTSVPTTTGRAPVVASSAPSGPSSAAPQQILTTPTSNAPSTQLDAPMSGPDSATSAVPAPCATASVATTCALRVEGACLRRAAERLEGEQHLVGRLRQVEGHARVRVAQRGADAADAREGRHRRRTSTGSSPGRWRSTVPRSWSGPKWSATTAQTRCVAAWRAPAEVAADDELQVGGEDLGREPAAQLGRARRERVLGDAGQPPHVVAERASADLAGRDRPALLGEQRNDGRQRRAERALARLEREAGRERRRARVGRREADGVRPGANGELAERAVSRRAGWAGRTGARASAPGQQSRARAAVGEPVGPRRRVPRQQSEEHALGLRDGDVPVCRGRRAATVGSHHAGVERARRGRRHRRGRSRPRSAGRRT